MSSGCGSERQEASAGQAASLALVGSVASQRTDAPEAGHLRPGPFCGIYSRALSVWRSGAGSHFFSDRSPVATSHGTRTRFVRDHQSRAGAPGLRVCEARSGRKSLQSGCSSLYRQAGRGDRGRMRESGRAIGLVLGADPFPGRYLLSFIAGQQPAAGDGRTLSTLCGTGCPGGG